MLRRLLPLGPVLLVALADGAGAHRLAFYLLLLAVPAAVAASLTCFGEALEGGGTEEGLQALLAALALLFVVAGAAARAPYVTQGALPTAAVSALVAVAVVLGLQLLAGLPALLAGLRSPAQRGYPG